MVLLIKKNFSNSKDRLTFGHPTHAGLKPKSKDLYILGHPTHDGLKPVLHPPRLGSQCTTAYFLKKQFFQNQPKLGGFISLQQNT
jgi:hypothetical protein